MATRIRADFIHDAIRARHGSVDNFVVAWEEMASSRPSLVPRSRATVHRWINTSSMPSKSEDLLSLAGALDLDPIVLVDLRASEIRKSFASEIWLFRNGSSKTTGLSALRPMFTPGSNWPNQRIAASVFGRQWSLRELVHAPTDGTFGFASLQIESHAKNWPQAYHFAYRKLNAVDGMWRIFGSVVADVGRVFRISENGDSETSLDAQSPGHLTVQTFFGHAAAEFRIASLDPFEIVEVEFPSTKTGVARFS